MELKYLSGLELGNLVNTRVLSPVEVIDYFEKIVTEHNPKLNAFVYTKFDESREEAKELEQRIMKGEYGGPFAGVPIGLKDFLPSKKGWYASHGGVKHFQTIDTVDSRFYRSARAQGCIAVGKTNAPSFGFRGTTDNKMYGPTCNPFNTKYNSGGSSGGSCAAVGSLMVPLAECGDAGGSTRIPSAWCNCFGFKASAGLIPSVCRPDAWTATHPYCTSGVAARTVTDSATMMYAMYRYDPRDPLSVHTPNTINHMLSRSSAQKVKTMRIGFTIDYNMFPAVDPEISGAVGRVVKALREFGASVEPVRFNFKHSLEEMVNSWFLSISIDDSLSPEVIKLVEEHPEDLPTEFIEWHKKARSATMQDYRKFHEIRTDILDAHLEVFKNYDIIISPVSSCMPVLNTTDHNTKGPNSIYGSKSEPLIGFAQTWMSNMTGNPAASIPAGLGSNNLPIGVQIVGRRYFDDDVFAVAYALEQLMPWKDYYKETV